MAISVVTVLVLGFFFLSYLRDPVSLAYFTIALLLPFIYLIIRVSKASGVDDYVFLSQWAKLIMLLGLLYAPVVNWLIRNYFNR
jgi:hypothetical protein